MKLYWQPLSRSPAPLLARLRAEGGVWRLRGRRGPGHLGLRHPGHRLHQVGPHLHLPPRNVTTRRNCVDATSQCLGCICEVLDFWWPKDAPNCFKKEIIRVINNEESRVETGTQTGSQAGTSEAAAEDSDDTSKETVVIKTQEPTGPSQNTQYC